MLNNLFQSPSWQMTQNDAQHLTDVILAWMQQNYIPTSAISPDYEQSDIPYDPPLRAMRSFGELGAIDYAKEVFYDKLGRPNDLWWRFYSDFSIFNYRNPDINGANSDVLTAVGQFTDDQQQKVAGFLAGSGDYSTLGQQWFLNGTALRGVVGAVGNSGSFSTTISALRILVTVHEGPHSQFRLSVVVAPKGGAKTVETTATDMKKGASNSGTGETGTTVSATGETAQSVNQSNETPTTAQAAAAAAGTAALQYPFTILEVLENDQIPVQPPPPANGAMSRRHGVPDQVPTSLLSEDTWPSLLIANGQWLNNGQWTVTQWPMNNNARLRRLIFFGPALLLPRWCSFLIPSFLCGPCPCRPATRRPTPPADIAAQVELALEGVSPFPLAQLYHGYFWAPGARTPWPLPPIAGGLPPSRPPNGREPRSSCRPLPRFSAPRSSPRPPSSLPPLKG